MSESSSSDVKLTVAPWVRITFGLAAALSVVSLALGGGFWSIVIGLASAFVAVMTSYEIRAGEWGVERTFRFLRPVRMQWADLTSVEEHSNTQNLVLRARYGKPLEISQKLVGINEFRRLLLEHAPPAALPDDVRAVIAHRIQVSEPQATSVLSAMGDGPPTHRDEPLSRWRENPFFILGLGAECSRAEVERTGQKLLALLAIDSKPARTFTSPMGVGIRTPESVRTAMAELRDPERRVLHEVWARLFVPASVPEGDAVVANDVVSEVGGKEDAGRPWPEALTAIGWRAP